LLQPEATHLADGLEVGCVGNECHFRFDFPEKVTFLLAGWRTVRTWKGNFEIGKGFQLASVRRPSRG
jgi:hypothetical protein